MATCPNCKKTLSCGCQKRKASDGKAVCSNCITAYENKKNVVRAAVPNNTQQVWKLPEDNSVPDGWKNFRNNSDNNT